MKPRLTATTSRLVKIAAVAALMVTYSSAIGAQQLPSSCSFSDNPPAPGSTVIKAAHINELRACINDLRTQRGLSTVPWSDATLTPAQSVIKAVHIIELRNALSAAFLAVPGLTAPTFTHNLNARSTLVAAIDIVELRNATLFLVSRAVPTNDTPPGPPPSSPDPLAPPPPETPPLAPITGTTVLVNGSFDQSPDWINSGSPEFQAIAATYGGSIQPFPWTENNLFQVTAVSGYIGIAEGGQDLANFIDALPPGDVNVVAHSHGGNVAIAATYFAHRQIRHLINLGTPINRDLTRLLGGSGAYSRCQISSNTDWVQFLGASPTQVKAFGNATYLSVIYASYAAEDLANEDWDDFAFDAAASALYADYAVEWWFSTKIEAIPPTYMFGGLRHQDLHEPPVWNAIWQVCAVN